MTWTPYELDRLALKIVLEAKKREDSDAKQRGKQLTDSKNLERNKKQSDLGSLNQVYKMRAACTYGLERFWGEHVRLSHAMDPTKQNNRNRQDNKAVEGDIRKAKIIIDTWLAFVGIMKTGGIHLPNTVVAFKASEPKYLTVDEIKSVSAQIWDLPPMEAQISLSVLTSLCDAIVWWTQRLKATTSDQEGDS